jgi:ferredoxin
MDGRWLVEVDHGVCIGSGMCVAAAPDAFELKGAHQSCPRQAEMDAEPSILDAAESCPTEAIKLTDVETGAVVFPTED